ncbi:MAG: bifunctional fucokinase/L-fucose-1-P-guanylyltransferase [Clostridia bacterium]|nr:bifunctional fucokinase/L-fucose-1-P-guanylyltransferase [Clostridia bacterium]
MKNMTSLFLSQSYKDTWDDYNRSLTKAGFAGWDYVVLTASNQKQAEGFMMQIEDRQKNGMLPSETHFAVIPDPEGKRVGSGGATLGVLKYISEHAKTTDFKNLKILVIHSGGDSKRVPQYSALGKLFSPVPHTLPDGRASTLFDEFMICMSSVPSRIREGMLLLSGDVLLLFNPLQIDYSGVGAAAISFKEDVQTGKNHGVFLNGEDGNVRKFLHKQTVETLTEQGAVNERGAVDIDTGAVVFSADMLKALFGLIAEEGKFDAFVNETVRLSLYGDFLYPLASDSTLEQFYNEAPEGEFCAELKEARQKVWEALRPFRMKLLRLAPAKFIHFGTTREIMELMAEGVENYKDLGWSRQVNSSITKNAGGYNSVLSDEAEIGENCYLEVSYVHHDAKVGNNVVLSYIDIHDETVPDNVVLHGLKQKDGKFVARIYGVTDNPKENMFFGQSLEVFLEKNGLKETDIWGSDNHTLWMANLYPACDNIKDAVAAALNVYAMAQGKGDKEAWRKAERQSLSSGFNHADPKAIIDWNQRMHELVCMDGLVKLIKAKVPAEDAKKLLQADKLTCIQQEWLERRLAQADFSMAMRLYYYIGVALGGAEGEKFIAKCFKTIQEGILKGTLNNLKFNETCKIAKDKHTVKLPLRVNWGGGWSDTPPYCMENGGTVLNAAIFLNGEKPVEVTLIKIPEKKIVFDSRDMDVHGEFDTIEPLQQTGDPYDPFALQKAALLACGIIPKEGHNLEEILTRLGGGFEMHSEVTNVPKGSGLGTSSILSAACVKAVFEFMGIAFTEDMLYSHVLCMEQIMSTGGGWQDQVGGVTSGIKYITSRPALNQQLKVEHVEIDEQTKKELNERFALIYTGQRRLARNLLRDVVGRYVGNQPDSLYALNEIQRVAVLMRFELERGNVDEFAKLLNRHWELSQMVDAGSTNTLIDQIFASIEDLICGKLICGAGGGGFLQVILKKGVTKEAVHKRLKEVFQDNSIDVWGCSLEF